MAHNTATELDPILHHKSGAFKSDNPTDDVSDTSLSLEEMSQPSSSNTNTEDMSDEDAESDPEDWENKRHELKFASYDFNSLLKQLDVPVKRATSSALKSLTPRTPYTRIGGPSTQKSNRTTTATSTSSSLQQKVKLLPPNAEPIQTLTPDHVDTTPKQMNKPEQNFSTSDPHSFDHNYLALIPPDQTQIWQTNIAFTIKPKEDIVEGIKQRLLAFVPTVVAKSRGNILAWDTESDLNPIRDLHTVCTSNLLAKYFKYQILTDGRVKGYMRFQVYSE